jgi:hypothetical protein
MPLIVAILFALSTLILSSGPASAFVRTETHADCANAEPDRQPFFGDLHIHTSYSQDAFSFDLRNDPDDAYAFAKGAPLFLPDSADDPAQTRMVQLARPLDFTAVTDHSEFLGALRVCQSPGEPGYDSADCMAIRGELAAAPPDRMLGLVLALLGWVNTGQINDPPMNMPFCSDPGVDCAAAAATVWQDTQDAAELHYDRTAACGFTTFVGYEYSSMPGGNNLHRNVIFRNDQVQAAPVSAIDTAHDVALLWSSLQQDCLDAAAGCDVLTIPHNSNLSNGLMFEDPPDPDVAATRAFFEPLAEIYQHKASSECRYDLRFDAGVETTDELCAFEQYSQLNLGGAFAPPAPPPDAFPPRAFLRSALRAGLALEQTLGVNPFQFGILASTDGHGGTSGFTDEAQYEGHLGSLDSTFFQNVANRIGLPTGSNSSGGLAVIWSEENSRDALFEAMRRRETYGTSGTRPIVRFFAGDVPQDLCAAPDFAAGGYVHGVPMGGTIGAVRGRRSPRFAVMALKDPGTMSDPGTDLQRVQIVKGWVDAGGATHEQVYDVAGDPDNGAGIDPTTCARTGTGSGSLCTVWEDPDFDADESAFYYARVLENPTCRWSTSQCLAVGVDVFADQATCLMQATAAGLGRATLAEVCCLNENTDPFIERVIQERAWTSPVWYQPETFGRLRAKLRLSPDPAGDQLRLRGRLRAVPDGVDPDTQDITIEVRNDAEIYRVTVPAGTMARRGSSRKFVWRDGSGSIDGLRDLVLAINGKGVGRVRLRTVRLDLPNAQPADQFVELRLSADDYAASHQRRWVFDGAQLQTR